MNSPSTKRLTSNQLVQDGIQEVQGASPIAGENVQEDCLTRRISMQLGLRRWGRSWGGGGYQKGISISPQQLLPWLRLFLKVTLTLTLSRPGAMSCPQALGHLRWLLRPLECTGVMWLPRPGHGRGFSLLLAVGIPCHHAGRRPVTHQ